MSLRPVILTLAALSCWSGPMWGQVLPGGVAPKPTAGDQPAQPKPAAFDDGWLSEMCLAELEQFAGTGEYAALAKRMKSAILARLACGHLEAMSTLNDMMYVFRACAYLPLAEETTGSKDFPKWLLANREVTRRLFRAMEDVPKPADALGALKQLVDAKPETVLEYPELAAAFATSVPLRHYRQQPSPASMTDSFRWYTNPKLEFRYDLKKMPYEMSRYLTNTRLDLAERQWAWGRYEKHNNPAKCYFHVKYDHAHYDKGVPKKCANIPYTLQNLRKVGGVCIEQAYYASEVCKALGMPATIVTGRGESGIGHAWAACLKVARRGKEAYWDSTTGRYEAHKYYTGDVRDPACGAKIQDNEMMLVGMAAQLPLKRREQADAALALARLVDRVRDGSPEVDLDTLKQFARRYDQRNAEKKGKPTASTAWIGQQTKIDLALVENLIDASVDRNLAHRPAWEFICQLRKADRLPVTSLDRFFNTLVTRTAKAYPDYSCRMVMRIVPTIPDADRREKVFRRAMSVYGSRPDLSGRILMTLGDDYQRQEKRANALKAYESAALRCVDIAELVLDASGRAQGLLLEVRRQDLAIKMYKRLFSKAKKQRTVFRTQTAHFQLGTRLAELLRDAGRESEARRIEARL